MGSSKPSTACSRRPSERQEAMDGSKPCAPSSTWLPETSTSQPSIRMPRHNRLLPATHSKFKRAKITDGSLDNTQVPALLSVKERRVSGIGCADGYPYPEDKQAGACDAEDPKFASWRGQESDKPQQSAHEQSGRRV